MQDIAVDASGNIWVSEFEMPVVQEFSNSGSYVTELGDISNLPYPDGTLGGFNQPQGIAIDPAGSIWVAQGHCRVTVKTPGNAFSVLIPTGCAGSASAGNACTPNGYGVGYFGNPISVAIVPPIIPGPHR